MAYVSADENIVYHAVFNHIVPAAIGCIPCGRRDRDSPGICKCHRSARRSYNRTHCFSTNAETYCLYRSARSRPDATFPSESALKQAPVLLISLRVHPYFLGFAAIPSTA
jgi:hypothetical protein